MSFRVERPSLLLRRIRTVGFAENLERRLSLSKIKSPFSVSASSVCSLPIFFFFFCPFLPLFEEDNTMHYFVFFQFNNLINSQYVPSSRFLPLGTIPTIHFHHLSTHATCITCVHVICDFCHISSHFSAPETRCLEKCVNSDCLRIRRNSTW